MSDAGHSWRDHQRDELVVRCHRQDLEHGLEKWANGTRLWRKGGLANYLDVLIAQRNLFEAELSFTATHRLHVVSIVQLDKALGGRWAQESDGKKGVG